MKAGYTSYCYRGDSLNNASMSFDPPFPLTLPLSPSLPPCTFFHANCMQKYTWIKNQQNSIMPIFSVRIKVFSGREKGLSLKLSQKAENNDIT